MPTAPKVAPAEQQAGGSGAGAGADPNYRRNMSLRVRIADVSTGMVKLETRVPAGEPVAELAEYGTVNGIESHRVGLVICASRLWWYISHVHWCAHGQMGVGSRYCFAVLILCVCVLCCGHRLPERPLRTGAPSLGPQHPGGVTLMVKEVVDGRPSAWGGGLAGSISMHMRLPGTPLAGCQQASAMVNAKALALQCSPRPAAAALRVCSAAHPRAVPPRTQSMLEQAMGPGGVLPQPGQPLVNLNSGKRLGCGAGRGRSCGVLWGGRTSRISDACIYHTTVLLKLFRACMLHLSDLLLRCRRDRQLLDTL